MIYILAIFVPPLALLLNGQPFSAIFNLAMIVPCIILGFFFPLLWLVPSAHGVHRDLHEARGPQAPRDRRRHREARPAAGVAAVRLSGTPCDPSAHARVQISALIAQGRYIGGNMNPINRRDFLRASLRQP